MLPLPLFLQHTEDDVPAHPACSHLVQSASTQPRHGFVPQQMPPLGAASGHSAAGCPLDPPLEPPLDPPLAPPLDPPLDVDDVPSE